VSERPGDPRPEGQADRLARLARAARALLVLAALLSAGAACAWRVMPAETWVDTARFVRPRDARAVADRRGVVLRNARVDGVDRRWVSLGEISPTLVAAVIAAEDVRFREHAGVDTRAVLRAAVLNLVPGRQRSGASTITQQLVKLVYGRPAGLASKGLEVVRAAALERLMSKDEILEQYLNRLPFGDRIEGVARASEAYFGHPVASVTIAEAALLAGVPQAPSITEPRRHLGRALRRRATVLERMHAAGMIAAAEHDAALHEPVNVVSAPVRPDEAPRFVDAALALDRGGSASRVGPTLRTTLDLALQHRAERELAGVVDALRARGVSNGAAVVVANETGEVLAYVAAARRGRADAGGSLDLLQRRRQPGSTLKPFAYGLLFERGGTAATVLADVALPMAGASGSQFEAHDYDRRERGPVRARVALASSLNLAALDAAGRVGQDALTARLRLLGLRGLGKAARYGAAAVLGGVDVAPVDLARSYAALARGGTMLDLALLPGPRGAPRQVFEPGAAAVVTDILADPVARADAFGADLISFLPETRFSLKTGTSSGWRDAWAAAYSGAFTVVVWLGDPRGAPTAGVSGFEGAAPVAVRILAAAHDVSRDAVAGEHGRAQPSLVPADVCPWSGLRPGPRCGHVVHERFVPGTQPARACEEHDEDGAFRLRPRFALWAQRARPAGVSANFLEPSASATLAVVEPGDGARILLEAGRGETRIPLRATAGGVEAHDVAWEVDGRRVGPDAWAAAEGRHVIVAIRGALRSPEAHVRVSAR
jgi:penicillin-binding protein 1C